MLDVQVTHLNVIEIGLFGRPQTHLTERAQFVGAVGIRNAERGRIGRKAIRGDAIDLFGADKELPWVVAFLHVEQPDMAVNARARVPSAVLLRRVIDPHGQDILAGTEFARDIDPETAVAIRMTAHHFAVQIDGAVHIDSFEVKFFLHGRLSQYFEVHGLAVPSHTCREVGAVVAGWGTSVELSLDAPVVREVEGAPGTVVERGGSPFVVVAQLEAPMLVEGQTVEGKRPRASEETN